MMRQLGVSLFVWSIAMPLQSIVADEFALQLREQKEAVAGSGTFERSTRDEKFAGNQTAIIVCDVWDLHHCWNAVSRLEEFAPRLNEVLVEARRRGAIVIHSPSDCMPAYLNHPARNRALAAPATKLPRDIECWCSRIPSEEKSLYPIDQSDGGEDDDPAVHAMWAAKLTSMGRNPGMPWKMQLNTIKIDAERDYISDRGDEVWNILEQRGIKNVVLTGVHTNMCVLGRPFGLRQMARNGKNVVLMRDMTDCMYNPKSWPYVDHFTGNDLVISHVERFVCPTITSDQVLGGPSFRSKFDTRKVSDVTNPPPSEKPDLITFEKQWSPLTLPSTWDATTKGEFKDYAGVAWFRCAVRIPKSWSEKQSLTLKLAASANDTQAWLNGKPLVAAAGRSTAALSLPLPIDAIVPDDANLLVLRIENKSANTSPLEPPQISGDKTLSLKGRWQFRLGDDPAWSNIPLPARFGASPDILFEP